MITSSPDCELEPSTCSRRGNPDTNGDGLGIEIAGRQPIYQGGQVMDALASSGTPLAVARTGPDGVVGRTYHELLQGMGEAYAWGQGDAGNPRGGWRYS